ncbi:hypothetical protein ACJRO7_031866 [Eucalyptus globulus]|uniref:Uncharacterized protein n=1 Tax=Eucalyptus globulus TaxID=34317 RepID=A0ABD3JNU6_EUCGL
MASLSLPCKFKALCLSTSSSPSSSRSRIAFISLGFPLASCTTRLLVSNGEKNPPHFSITCEATPTKRAEKRRIYNKAHKSEIRTRMKKRSRDVGQELHRGGQESAKSLVAGEKRVRQVLWWVRGLSIVVITLE